MAQLQAVPATEFSLEGKSPAERVEERMSIPLEFSPHQYAVLLLHIAAEIEHALMVEYLYAAYSLGGAQVPEARRRDVAMWQEIIAGIAKEEMGHLMTVQNLLRCIGGPLNLDREDYPWDSEFLPFPFRLEPLTRASLARFIVAESPDGWQGDEADTIRELARQGIDEDVKLNRVGELYAVLEKLFADSSLIPDSEFRAETLPYQATFDEWGRGYRSGARGHVQGGGPVGTPNVLLLPISGRTEALAALKAISIQGEACPDDDPEAISHFARFLDIFQHFPEQETWPSRPAPINPGVFPDLANDGDEEAPATITPITHPEARLWASLCNIRYQMLLTSLLHTFDFAGNLSPSSAMTPRGLLIHSTFGEMYNLRVVSTILMQTPLAAGDEQLVAGPPFQMPYTLDLPLDEADRWRVHLDLLQSSQCLIDALLEQAPMERHDYLRALRGGDDRLAVSIGQIIHGCGSRPAYLPH
jgi:hypothetical protein